MPRPIGRASLTWPLAAVLAFAFVLRFVVAQASPTILWPDEVFQSLEQAHRLVYGNGILPWEFRVGARSWLLPGALAPLMRATGPLASGSLGYLAGVRFALSALSLTVPAVSYLSARRAFGTGGALVAALVAATWFELVFFAPKALTEAVATHLLVPGLYLAAGSERASVRRLAAAGALVGLAVAFRVHLSVAALVPLVWIARARGGRGALVFAAAAFAPLALSGLLDLATWGHPFHSYWLNFKLNVLEGKSAAYGTAPWYGYFGVLGNVWSWGALVVVPLALVGAARQPMFGVTALVLVAVHSALAHKEYRFIYPALALVVVLAGVGLAAVATRVARRSRRHARLAPAVLPVFTVLLVGLSGVLAARYDWAATSLVGSSGEPTNMWRHLRGSIFAFQALSSDPSLCGVGLANRRWSRTAGYAHLHRDVPIFEIRSDAAFERYLPAFNALVAPHDAPPRVGPFVRERCWDEICVLRRPGTCTKIDDYDINERIERAGE